MAIVPECRSKGSSCFVCAQAGCPDCMNELLRRNKGLMLVVLRRQYPGKCDYADLIQEGWIGLWQAILHYEAERGVAFSTYAGRVIRNQIWSAVRQGWKAQGWLECERARDRLSELIAAWQQEQERQALQQGLACLPARLRGVVEQAYGLKGEAPLSLTEIGRALGVTGERVRQLRNEALVLLRLPALSVKLRSLWERDSRRDYRQARRTNDAWLQRRRGLK